MNTRAAKKIQQTISGSDAKSAPASLPVTPARGASRERLLISEAARTAPSGRRRTQIPRLLQMSPAQQQQLRDWLTVEGVKYTEAVKRLRERFNVSVSRDAVFRFFHEQCHSEPAAPAANEAKPLLDIVIDAAGVSVRVQVLAPPGTTLQTNTENPR